MKVIVVISGFTQKKHQNTGSRQLWHKLLWEDVAVNGSEWHITGEISSNGIGTAHSDTPNLTSML